MSVVEFFGAEQQPKAQIFKGNAAAYVFFMVFPCSLVTFTNSNQLIYMCENKMVQIPILHKCAFKTFYPRVVLYTAQ